MSKQRSGRPELPASQRREEILRFVVTKAEGAEIRSKAKQQRMSLSEYLRQVALKG
jgi:hypothetical protein